MLTVHPRRSLHLADGHHPRGQPHLSAASGLVHHQGRFYVVADDEHHLGVFADHDDSAPVQLLRLWPDDLPEKKAARKALKPDLEALLLIAHLPGRPHGALLALGSGSRANRRRGVLLPFAADGQLDGMVQPVDLSAIYTPLEAAFTQLNIEGAFVLGDELRLLQRGNKGDARNACIAYALADWHRWLTDRAAPVPEVRRIDAIALGDVGGVPLGFTDGVALTDGGWAFSAVAENTDDAYLDGACAGSVVGVVGPDGVLRKMAALDGAWKVEGLSAAHEGTQLRLAMVTDADDPDIASQLVTAVLPLR
jgi:hypothetical protein